MKTAVIAFLAGIILAAPTVAHSAGWTNDQQTTAIVNLQAKVKNMNAKFHCLANSAKPMYSHDKTIDVPLSQFEVVHDAYGNIMPEDTTGSVDLTFMTHSLTSHQGGTGFYEGALVNEACFMLPPAP